MLFKLFATAFLTLFLTSIAAVLTQSENSKLEEIIQILSVFGVIGSLTLMIALGFYGIWFKL